jgi:hypothetical protein
MMLRLPQLRNRFGGAPDIPKVKGITPWNVVFLVRLGKLEQMKQGAATITNGDQQERTLEKEWAGSMISATLIRQEGEGFGATVGWQQFWGQGC